MTIFLAAPLIFLILINGLSFSGPVAAEMISQPPQNKSAPPSTPVPSGGPSVPVPTPTPSVPGHSDPVPETTGPETKTGKTSIRSSRRPSKPSPLPPVVAIPDTNSIETPPGVIPMPKSTAAPVHAPEHLLQRSRARRISGVHSRPVIKIEPRIKVQEIEEDPYPMALIRPFLLDGLIVPFKDDLDGTPYLVGLQDQHPTVGKGYYIYARGLCDVEQKHYTILGPGKSYFHPATKECLGYHAPIIGQAELTILGPVSQLQVIDAVEVVERKNLLIPSYALPPVRDFKAKPATTPIEGIILDVKEDWGDIGKNNTLILSIGCREGLMEGEYLDVYKVTARGAICIGCPPKLPDLRIGRVLVFRVYEKLSLALVVEAWERIDLLDRVRSPEICNPRPGIAIFEPPSH